MLKLYSYLYGLFGTDGNVRRTEDNHIYDLTLELIDEDIIDKINGVLPNCSKTERKRDTNFKKIFIVIFCIVIIKILFNGVKIIVFL